MNRVRIAVAIIILLLVGAGVYYFYSRKKHAPPATPTIPGITSLLPTAKIKISGVEVNNFQKSPIEKNSEGDITFGKTNDFSLIYLKSFDEFLVSVLGSPFAEARYAAEADFLTKLGISKEEACRLKVSVTTPAFVNPAEAGKVYKLSFCQ